LFCNPPFKVVRPAVVNVLDNVVALFTTNVLLNVVAPVTPNVPEIVLFPKKLCVPVVTIPLDVKLASGIVVFVMVVIKPLEFTESVGISKLVPYVLEITPVLANVNAVDEPVLPFPVTSPVKFNDPEIAVVVIVVILPFASTVTTGNAVEEPKVPAVTPVLVKVAVKPLVVISPVRLPDATPFEPSVTKSDEVDNEGSVNVPVIVVAPVTPNVPVIVALPLLVNVPLFMIPPFVVANPVEVKVPVFVILPLFCNPPFKVVS